ncbi:hypothetical protein M0R45_023995 [Rubus argutus]|uniref:Cytochrome P450 n=1 Tax=Rubus argutus TaxID=59490 RepID=A0AAW1WQ70_RUBAR
MALLPLLKQLLQELQRSTLLNLVLYANEEEVAELVNRIRKVCLGEFPINLSQMLITTSSNIMSRCILGEKFVEDGDWYGETSRRFMVQLMSFSFGDFFPCLSWIDTLIGFIARLKATFAELDGFFDQLIEEHKNGKEGEPKKKDFVDILLQLQKDAIHDFDLTRDNLKAIIQDMFVAGSVTTLNNNGMTFAVASAEYVLANLLYWFDWKLPSGDTLAEALDISEVYGITVNKKTPLYLLPVPYSP